MNRNESLKNILQNKREHFISKKTDWILQHVKERFCHTEKVKTVDIK